MKHTLTFFAACFAALISFNAANADVVWCEDFGSYADGDNPSGMTAIGNGTFDNNGSVVVNANGQLVHTADTGRDTTGVMGASGEGCAKFSIDVAFLGDDVVPNSDGNFPDPTDIFFLQMTEGGRSTNGTPVAGMSLTVDAGNHSISTDATSLTELCFFANTSGAAVDYIAPDGSTQTINNNAFAYWAGGTLINGNASNATNGATPTGAGLRSMYINTFNGQEGESWVFDNMKLETFDHIIAVPEPTSGLILVGFGLLAISRRKRN